MRKMWIILAMAFVAGLAFATPASISDVLGTGSYVGGAVAQFCAALRAFLPVAAMLMVIVAGVIYAGGQMMGAETRARANVWATAALTGALVAVLIAVVAPPVLATMYGETTAWTC
jgi:hypothetical protein